MSTRISCNKLFCVLELQVFSSIFGHLGITRSQKPFFQIQISHRSINSQAAESRAEFELNTCSPKISNNLSHEIRVGTRFCLRVLLFLRHQSPSLSTRPTFRGMAEVRTLKLDFMVKKWRNNKKKVFRYTYFHFI